MTKIKNKNYQRENRTDGNHTRALLIKHAGIMFAEHGYQAISSKDICWAASVTPASVNYHFGSKEGLYHEVLMEAERVISSSASFEQLTSPSISAKDALAGFLYNRFYDTIVHSGAWQYQLLIREAFMPSKSRSIAAFVGDRHACASLYVGGYSSTTRPYSARTPYGT